MATDVSRLLRTPVTLVVLATNTIVFIACQTEPGIDLVGRMFSSPIAGLVFSAFVHIDVVHFLMNTMVLYQVGPILERWLGKTTLYAGFYLLAALVSSAAQLLFSGPGIGASGVLYAMVGYLWIKQRRHPDRFAYILAPGAFRPLFVWLVLGFVLSYTGMMRIGNAAHVGGLLFGILVANPWGARTGLDPTPGLARPEP
ncbi:MAG: rhomboid family intramembrane serine protease [Acidobacteriota bacterium]